MGKEKKEKKSKKVKKEKEESSTVTAEPQAKPIGSGKEYEELVERVNAIAKPLASKSLTKKAYKAVKKAHKAKRLCRGVKEVGKALRKGAKGVCLIAGNISPIDVITHMPIVCEEAKVPYCYVPSKEDLGAAGLTKRPTSIVLIKTSDSDDFKALNEEVAALAS